MNVNRKSAQGLSRRSWIQGGALATVAITERTMAAFQDHTQLPPRGQVRWAMMTDVHYADKEPAGTRHYRQTLPRMQAAANLLSDLRLDFVIELGDMIDAAESVAVEQAYVRTILKPLLAMPGRNYFVLGNHCVQTLSKNDFLALVGQRASCFSFQAGPMTGIVLDACFRSDGTPYGRGNFQWTDANIPAAELQWLRKELKRAAAPVVVFVHQRLDVDNHYGIKNAPAVRKILEQSRKVMAVFQGHSHANDARRLGDIDYITLAAMVEGDGADRNAFAIADLSEKGGIQVTGFGQQASCRAGVAASAQGSSKSG